MRIKTWHIILFGGLLLIGGIGLGFIMNELWFPHILVVLGFEIVIFESVRRYILNKSSLKIWGIAILIFSVVNFLRHSIFFIVISRIGELFENDPEFIWFLVRETIWLIMSIWILICGINLIKLNAELSFNEYIESKQFKILSIGIIILFILEIPIFGIHGDFGGGLHGHGFWEGGTHIH